jgi:uncharacterized protein YodC (DUF2158 family)
MAEAFKPGDTVRLKSGGPDMTVDSISDSYGVPQVYCEWFNSKDEPQSKSFAPTSLVKVDD